MRYLKLYLLAAFTVTAFSSITMVATAALPTQLSLAGFSNSFLKAESSVAKTKFTGIVNLTGTGYQFILYPSGGEMESLGTAELSFTKAMFGTKNCKANGDTSGNVLLQGEWHMVLASSGGGAKLFLILFTIIISFVVECEGTNIVISGGQLVDAEPFGSEVTELTAATGKCSGNTAAFSNYLTDSQTSMAAGLKSEIGGLKSATCVEVEGTQHLRSIDMFEVMEP